MPTLTFSWRVTGVGSASCLVADQDAQFSAYASYISTAPEDLLNAVTRIVLGQRHVEAVFQGEPGSYLWVFDRYGRYVDIQLIFLEHVRQPAVDGRVVWESRRQTVEALAQALIKAFDLVSADPGEDYYLKEWTSPFPRSDLEDLRGAWNDASAAATNLAEPRSQQPNL